MRKSRLLDDDEQGMVALLMFQAWKINNDEKALAEEKKIQALDGMSQLDKIEDKRPEQKKMDCLLGKVGGTVETAQEKETQDWSNCGLDDTDVEVLEYDS